MFAILVKMTDDVVDGEDIDDGFKKGFLCC
jgi:hypothetical protein